MNDSYATVDQAGFPPPEGDSLAKEQQNNRLYSGMVMMLRRALRTGSGGPALTRWLDQARRFVADPDNTDALAALLYQGLSQHLHSVPNPSGETVLERGLVYHATHI